MLPVAEALENEGYTVRVPTLPGHDDSLESFGRTRFRDWAHAAEASYGDLKREAGEVVVCGLSMGGSLALHIAERYEPAGVVTIAAPLWIYSLLPPRMRDWRLPFVPYLKHVRPVWPAGPRRPESETIAPWRGYEGAIMLEPLDSLMRGLRTVRRNIGRVRAPLLAMQAPGDRSVHIDNMWEILRGVSSSERHGILMPILEGVTSQHVLTTHRETRERVQDNILAFARRISSGRGPYQAY